MKYLFIILCLAQNLWSAPLLVSENLGDNSYFSSGYLNNIIVAEGPWKAFDGNPESSWIAEDEPNSYIEVNLGSVFNISKINLLNFQFGLQGPVEHEIWFSHNPISYDYSQATLVNTFNGIFNDYHLSEFDGFGNLTAQYVQIRTTLTPERASWREIEVYANTGVNAIPEPSTYALIAVGLVGLGVIRKNVI